MTVRENIVPTHWRVFGSGGRVALVEASSEDEYNAAIRHLRWEVWGREKARLHSCDACGSVGPWTDSWLWFGSYKNQDDGKKIVKTCSEACRVEAKRLGLVPKNAAMEIAE